MKLTIDVPMHYLDHIKQIDGCLNGDCVIRRPSGQMTNTSCKGDRDLQYWLAADFRLAKSVAVVLGKVIEQAEGEVQE